MMKCWSRARLLGMAGAHIHSGSDARIQVLEFDSAERELWQIPSGSLLIAPVDGVGELRTPESSVLLEPGALVHLCKGDAFALRSSDATRLLLVQMIWMPGISA